ncbi:Uncharacterised protein [Mycobacteroides abscessus subsp. bolletii]|nr:Uncharacterised protein [Mycobacteroides abscessus subsp. bolletii]SKH12267.1 Uncharacterised protein [Mycobacteroides abscessus subsp. bolletii]SKH96513.1 Uncharacterised protein [Mycobacteroides abscessus subsp. bolletii]SKK43281.1 Uncharacterised protein [Mycobacteroides abscessus subsp. bolletii]SLJ80906.1 Uncharacterised protein [Mycobacteroides abscessus subsp. bolletii]
MYVSAISRKNAVTSFIWTSSESAMPRMGVSVRCESARKRSSNRTCDTKFGKDSEATREASTRSSNLRPPDWLSPSRTARPVSAELHGMSCRQSGTISTSWPAASMPLASSGCISLWMPFAVFNNSISRCRVALPAPPGNSTARWVTSRSLRTTFTPTES